MILLRILVVDFIFYNILIFPLLLLLRFLLLCSYSTRCLHVDLFLVFLFRIYDFFFFTMRIHVASQIEKFLVLISLNIAQSLVSLLLSEILLALLCFYFSYISYSYK